ncbi:MAG: hypothetical protein LBM62_08675, partial [Mediterranea sp.]|nr:hypothetical protein [Mediterranea sp.]
MKIRMFLDVWCIASLVVATLSLQGCVDEYTTGSCPDGDNAYVTLTLQAGRPETGSATGRAVNVTDEAGIDDISVLVFRRNTAEDGTTTETLSYQAEATKVVGSKGVYSTTVKLLKSHNGEQYSVMVIANCGGSVGYPLYGKTKAQVQQALTFGVDKMPSDYIPMWGESDFGVITGNSFGGGITDIKMLRALARFDVGFVYNATSGLSNGSYQGLSNYSLESVHVYRTRDKGYVIPLEGNYTVSKNSQTGAVENVIAKKASIPGDANLLNPGTSKDDNGIEYTTVATRGFVEQIYIPENSADNTAQTTIIVVGIKEHTTGHVGYYRMDMGYNSDQTHRQVLRNYRYIFSITKVNSDGLNTPDDALNADDADLIYNVLPWNDKDNSDLWVSGNYYFEVSPRQVRLPAQASADRTVEYKTNLPGELISWAWDKAKPDSIRFDQVETVAGTDKHGYPTINGVLTFSAPSNNTGAELNDPLNFKAGDIVGVVTVTQPPLPMDYTICFKKEYLFGNYMIDSIPNANEHFLELDLGNISDEALGVEWMIATDTVNGLYFSGKGVFTRTPLQHVTLQAYATKPMVPGVVKLHLKYNNSTATPDAVKFPCEKEVQVVIGFKPKKILVYGGNEYCAGGTTHSNQFLVGKIGGLNPNFSLTGSVPVQELTIVSGGAFGVADDNTNGGKLIETANADIIIIGATGAISTNNATRLKNYINKGGVLLMFDEYTSSNTSYNTIFAGANGEPLVTRHDTGWNNTPAIIYDEVDPDRTLDNDPIISGVPQKSKDPDSKADPYFKDAYFGGNLQGLHVGCDVRSTYYS